MNERLSTKRTRGISASALRTWGIFFLAIGIAGRSVIQNSILQLGSVSNAELFEAMQANPEIMSYATLALVFQAVETCAAPIFAFLLVEGYLHTSDFKNYIVRVLGCAVLSEIPYNLAMSARLVDLDTRNPAFALVLCLVMMFFFQKYEGKGLKKFGMKAMVFIAAFLWCPMLGIEAGICLVVMVAVLWALRNKPAMRGIFGFSSSMVCSVFDLFYMASSMSFIFVHLYNGEQGNRNKYFNYLVYPVILLVVGLAAMFVG